MQSIVTMREGWRGGQARLPSSGSVGARMAPRTPQGILLDPHGHPRCWWCGDDPLYQGYHDAELGFPVTNDQRLFEKICLEGFQSGLSWLTILRKREGFRRAFAEFDFHRMARFRADKADRLMQDASIVRHRGKIESALSNAKRAVALVDEVGSRSMRSL